MSVCNNPVTDGVGNFVRRDIWVLKLAGLETDVGIVAENSLGSWVSAFHLEREMERKRQGEERI